MLQSKQASGRAALLPTRELAPPSAPLTDAIEDRAKNLAVADLQTFPISADNTRLERRSTPDSSEHRGDNFSGTLTRRAIASAIANRCESVSQIEAKSLLDEVIKEIVDALVLGEDVQFRKFGSFFVREKSARPGRNPRTGVNAPVSARKVVVFRASSDFQEAVNGETPANPVENRRATAARLINLERRAQFGQ